MSKSKVHAVPTKSGWGPGPWQDEPDELTWESHGFKCLIIRNMSLSGSLNGYVGVPPGHPWHGASTDDLDPDVHGGVTWAGDMKCDRVYEAQLLSIEELESLWFVGFDTGHAFDHQPAMAAFLGVISQGLSAPLTIPGTYRDLAYVKEQVENLARQAREAT